MSIKRIFLACMVIVAVFMAAAPVSSVYADNPLATGCEKLTPEERKNATACAPQGDKNPLAGPDGLINNIAKGVALVAGAIAVIVIIVSGITMVTSSGDSQSFKTARNGVIYSAVGLAVILIAQALVALVLNGVK